MWRWWILAGLVVMALGASAYWVVFRGGRDMGPCASTIEWHFSPPVVGEDFYRSYTPHLGVDIAETAKLTLTIRKDGDDGGRFVPETNVSFVVTDMPRWTECLVIWDLPRHSTAVTRLPAEPGEETEHTGEWSFVDHWGVLVRPGEYVVHARVRIRDEVDMQESGNMVVFRRVSVGNDELNAARPKYPPVPVDPFACGPPTDAMDAASASSRGKDLLRAANQDENLLRFQSAPLLDEHRVPTGRHGIRVVTWKPPEEMSEDSLLRGLPECLEGVPVQFVVRPDGCGVAQVRGRREESSVCAFLNEERYDPQ